MTTTRPTNVKYYTLSKNPNPRDERTTYLPAVKPHMAYKRYYSSTLKGWSFSDEDMPVIRHRIKKYKKSMNRPSKKQKKK